MYHFMFRHGLARDQSDADECLLNVDRVTLVIYVFSILGFMVSLFEAQIGLEIMK